MKRARSHIVEPGYTQEDPYSDPGVSTIKEQRCHCCGRPHLRNSPFCCQRCACRYNQRARKDQRVEVKTCAACKKTFATHDKRRRTCSEICTENWCYFQRQREWRRQRGEIKYHLDVGKFGPRPACHVYGVDLFAETLEQVNCTTCKRSLAYRRLQDESEKTSRLPRVQETPAR